MRKKEASMKYKLGLDLGSTSLGWAVLELDDKDNITGLKDLGVRIFPDGRDAKKHTPINVERRNARTMRRRGDRVKLRKKAILELIHKNKMDFDSLPDPYQLRTDALDRKLELWELGRVFFHLALRRGFKSNRKELRGDEGGKLKQATERLQSELKNYRTIGEYIHKARDGHRFSNQFAGTKINDNAVYPTRDMYIDEFSKIWTKQSEYHNFMTDDLRK
jgi:CRISPR-associated endonuclease Csn1